VALRPGLWKRAGLNGEICGLDYAGALALIPEGCDRAKLPRLLMAAEAGLVTAAAAQRDKS
jgi:hypothetical protein